MVNDFHYFFVVNSHTHYGFTHVRVLGFLFKEFVQIVDSDNFFMYLLSFIKVRNYFTGLQFFGRILVPKFTQTDYLLRCQLIVLFVLQLFNDVKLSLLSDVRKSNSV